MALLGLQRLMSVQHEQRRRRRRVLARHRSTVNERTESPSPRVSDGDSQSGTAVGYPIPHLPEDIWRHIHSLMPMCDAARAACLSHAFLRSWRCRPRLTLTWRILCGKSLKGNFSDIIDSILRNHSGIGSKKFELDLFDMDNTFPYINSWLQVALTPGIEDLTLTLYKNCNFPCSLLFDRVRNSIRCLRLNSCVFRPKEELGPLGSLTSLHLHYVCITGDELECLLSNSLSLQHLDLYDCKEIITLKIPQVLQELSRLTVVACWKLRALESKAPNLSNIHLRGKKIKLSLECALQIKDLRLCRPNVVHYARAELPLIMPNLESLDIRTGDEVINTPMLPTKFLKLRDLAISLREWSISPSYDYFSLISFLDACPSLETLYLDVSVLVMRHESVFGHSSHLRQLPEHHHDRLKTVEIIGFSSAKSLIELTCCLVNGAISIESITLDTLNGSDRCSQGNITACWPIDKAVLEEASRAVMAIRRYIEDKVPRTAKLTVLEPCTRCHSSACG
ncbi:hypothetical protein BS78_07G016600 [Paspalum vaginatum]|nr:hypothetical protein BS78_07G016600 [Paspalum vaginatum]